MNKAGFSTVHEIILPPRAQRFNGLLPALPARARVAYLASLRFKYTVAKSRIKNRRLRRKMKPQWAAIMTAHCVVISEAFPLLNYIGALGWRVMKAIQDFSNEMIAAQHAHARR